MTQLDAASQTDNPQRALEELETVYATAPVGLSFMDPELRFLRINQLQAAMNGLPPEAHIGRTLREMLPQLADAVEPLLLQVLETGRPLLNIETRGFIPADPHNERYWVASYHPVRSKVGQTLGVNVVVLEVTDRVRAQQALRESEEQFRTLVEQASDAFFVHDEQGRFVNVNRKAEETLGYTREELLRLTVPDVQADFDLARAQQVWNRIRPGEAVTVYGHHRRKDGSLYPVEVRITTCELAGRRLYLGLVRDVSSRQRAEDALRESEERYRLVIRATNDVVWDWDLVLNQVNWSPTLHDRFGFSLADAGTDVEWWIEHVHPDDRARVQRSIYDVIESRQEHWRDQYRFLRSDGTYATVLDRGFLVRDDSGRAARMIGSMLDLTEQLETAAALSASEERFRTLIESIPQLIWTCDPDGRCDYLSRQWVEYTGVPAEQQTGTGWLEQVHPDDRDSIGRHWQTALENSQDMDSEYRLLGADGHYRWFKAKAVPLKTPAGEILKWFGTSTNIELQKQVEASLRRSNADLQQFAYVASHDLQEPLRTISIYTEMLGEKLRENADPRAHRYMEQVILAARRMSTLIDDLLAYSRANREGQRTSATVNLNKVLEEAVSDLRGRIDELHAVVTSSDLPTVEGDPAMLKQVFQNLLSNSLKYHREGVPPIIRLDCSSDPSAWRIAVRDNGQGFKPEFAETIFGIFKRLHGQSVPGTGIGLAICRTVIERHGGRIWAEGTPGKGAAFYFTLPRAWRNA